MTPERDILVDLLDQLDRIARGASIDRAMLGEPPTTPEAFEAMTPAAQSFSRALLKSIEQYVDTLQRTIRVQLREAGFRLKGMTPLDVANMAEELDQIADARAFRKVIELRNELTHEYPDDAATRFARFTRAVEALPFLDDAASRVRRFATTRLPGRSR